MKNSQRGFVETPGGGSEDIPDANQASWLTRLRYRIIVFLAGRSVVLVNARFEVSAEACLEVTDCPDGALIGNCSFTFPLKVSYGARNGL